MENQIKEILEKIDELLYPLKPVEHNQVIDTLLSKIEDRRDLR